MDEPQPQYATRRSRRDAAGAQSRSSSVGLLIVIVLGLAVALYPSMADWFSRLNHNNEISEYRQVTQQLDPAVRSEALALADAYNARMPQGPLRDAFAYESPDSEVQAGYAAYEQLLRISESGVIGRVKLASAGIDLPIYHGTDDEVISRGAGHLYGSSLPVGGPTTHSVLTAHSGLASASLFTPLHDVKLGDEFWIDVLGEQHWYRVDQIVTVEPGDLREMQIVEGRDFVTLFTCTPVGVNSHRLLVRGERIEAPASEVGAMQGDVEAGFPWWLLAFVGGTAVASVLVFRTGPRGRRGEDPAVAGPPVIAG
ncbi:class C sortase [Salinibacterium sp. ZJ77]|uniref:class C sortase n=1 Tax=Salinibacterium sp. ZJ77 TaxID=2708337 RepID=UPI001FBB33A9|nr:class C sortase [Salinibacterium sp. ZJ77]